MFSKFGINGHDIVGRNLTINGNRVVIDDKDVTPEAKDIRIEVTGNVGKLEIDYCRELVVTGDVESLRTGSGDVTIEGNVYGPLTTSSGDVSVEGTVENNITTSSGDVQIGGKVLGSVKTSSGDITTG